jgi:hypothetical protein
MLTRAIYDEIIEVLIDLSDEAKQRREWVEGVPTIVAGQPQIYSWSETYLDAEDYLYSDFVITDLVADGLSESDAETMVFIREALKSLVDEYGIDDEHASAVIEDQRFGEIRAWARQLIPTIGRLGRIAPYG